nr:tandem-95 repeat protein [Opitutaceae bacterium]
MTLEPKRTRHIPAIPGSPGLIRNAARGWATRAIARGLRSIACGMLCASAVAGGAQLTLTWQDNSSNELGFRIERSSAGGSFMMIGSTGPDITTYVDSGVADGTAYTYRVCAFNAGGSSAYSATASATTPSSANAAPTISSIPAVSIGANSSSTPMAFTVGDAETAAGSLTVTAASSNTALLPVTGIVLGGSGASRTVTLTPAPNQSGSASVTLTVSDGVNIAKTTFAVTVNAVNTAPTIGDLENRTVDSGANSGVIAFSVGDAQTAAGSLVVTASSSNPILVPDSNIVLGGSGANRTISLQPSAGQSGVATITVRVSDGSLSVSDSFVLTVRAPNTSPTISDIPNQVVAAGSSTNAIRFTVGDAQTSASLLTVSAASTNPTLVPSSSLALSGSGSTRTLVVQPAAGQSGTATITVTVSDGTSASSDSFVLTVTAPNTAPTITAIPNASIEANNASTPLLFVVGDAQTPASDLVVTAQSTNLTLVPQANIAFGGSGANRSVTIVPAANQSGSAGITVTVSDGDLSTSRSFAVTVTAANTPPTISPVASRTIEVNTSTGALSFTVADAQTQAAAIQVNATSSNTALVSGAGLAISGSGSIRTITVTPTPNQIGATTITVTANDGTQSSSMTFVVTVNATATAPTISQIADVTLSVNGSTSAIPFSVSHATTPAASLIVTASSSDPVLLPLSGILLGGSEVNRTVSVTPAAGRTGSATVTIVVSDGTLSASESFLVTVNEVNSAPTISPIGDRTINVNRSTGAIAFTIGDSGTAPGSLVVTAATSNPALLPLSGISFGGSGANRTILATPATDKSGVSIVTVSVSDGSLTSSSSFSVTVQGVNAVPTIGSIANQSIGRSGTTGTIGFSVNDPDSPADSLVLTAQSSNLSLLPLSGIVFGGSGSARTIALTPAPGMAGNSTVTVTVSDGSSSASTSLVLSVTGENLSPTITPIANLVLVAGNSSELMPFLVGDVETLPGQLVVSASSSNPTLVSNGGIQLSGEGSSRSIRIFPATALTGTAAITLTVSDGVASASTSFIVDVVPSSEAPTISSLSNRNLPLGSGTGPITFVVGDRVISAELLTVSVNSSNLGLVPLSSVVLGGSGAQRTISVTPAAGVTGTATIALSVSNGTKTTSTSFELSVSAPNTAPVISAVPAQALEMGIPSNAIPFSVSDAESPAGNLNVTAQVSDPTLIEAQGVSFSGVDIDRTVTITPVSGKTGTAMVTLIVSDGALSASTSFTVTVSPRNAPPTITGIGSRSVTMGTTTAAIDFFVGDALTPAENLVVSATSSNTGLVPNSALSFGGSGANRWLKATPVAGQTGTTTVTVTVSDGELSASTSFVLAVTVPNTAPTLGAPSNRATVIGRSSGAIEFTVDDVETPAGSLTVTALSSNQTLLPNQNIVLGGSGENRTITLMPSSNQMGSVSVTLSVSDGSLVTTGSFVLTITAQS